MGKIFSGIIGGVVGFLVGGPVGAAIGFGIGMTKVGEKLVNKVMDFVLKPFLGAFGVPNDGGGNAAREEGVVITKRISLAVKRKLSKASSICKCSSIVNVFSTRRIDG